MQRNAPWVMATWGELFYFIILFYFILYFLIFGREKKTGELIDYGGGSQFFFLFYFGFLVYSLDFKYEN